MQSVFEKLISFILGNVSQSFQRTDHHAVSAERSLGLQKNHEVHGRELLKAIFQKGERS
jgi:hypothetical protein